MEFLDKMLFEYALSNLTCWSQNVETKCIKILALAFHLD